jgi:ABC-type transport system involved in multi-copper enzyme maturation permease subunit
VPVANPIVRRELLELLRTRRAVAAQVALATACALLVLVRWPTGGVSDLSGARSLQVLRVFGYGLLAGVIFLVPAYPATALVRDRVRGTLALLLNSPMSATAIYLGKLGAVLGFAGLLLAMTLPAAAACHALGGAPVRGGVGWLYLVLAAAAVQLSTIALWVSGRSRSIDGALRWSYALVLAVCALPLIPHGFLEGDAGPVADVADWVRCLSPVPAVLEVLGQGGAGSHGMADGGGTVDRYLLLAGASSIAFALLTVRTLARSPLDAARPPGVMTEDRSRGGRAARRILFLVDPRRRTRPTSWWVNPVMVKEFRTRRFGRGHWMIRLIALSALMSLGLTYAAATGSLGWGPAVIGGALVILQATLLLLFAPSLGAGLISAEREGGGWHLLRTTPLSPGRILRGKLLSVAWPLGLLLCATIPGYVVLMTADPDQAPQARRVVACLLTLAVFAVLVAAAASSVARTTAAAMAIANLVLAGVCIGPLLVWLGRDAPFGHGTVEVALMISPLAAALHAAETPGFRDYQLLPTNWYVIGGASLALLGFLMIRVRQLCRPE